MAEPCHPWRGPRTNSKRLSILFWCAATAWDACQKTERFKCHIVHPDSCIICDILSNIIRNTKPHNYERMHLHLLLAVICPILTRSVSCPTSKARRGDPTCARLQYDAPDQGWVEAGRGSPCRKEVVLHSLKILWWQNFCILNMWKKELSLDLMVTWDDDWCDLKVFISARRRWFVTLDGVQKHFNACGWWKRRAIPSSSLRWDCVELPS